MLAPDDRALLLDALRPPSGMRLERAVGTTFTLDLATALTVPLALAGHALSHNPDPIAMMETIRGSADRVDIFAQAGAIAAGRWPSDLAALLEAVVHEVPRPRPGHLFHPKAWVAHYEDAEGNDAYRVLVLSRNLTADRSWDVVVRLDGMPGSRINRDNDGLVRFVAAMPQLSKVPLAEDRSEAIMGLADELRRVDWELPEGAARLRFWPMGLPGRRPLKLDDLFLGYRHLVISPFVTADGLDAVIRPMGQGSEVTLISRAEELDKLPTGALDDLTVQVIDPAAGLSDEDESDGAMGADVPAPPPFGALHAKAIVVERNHRARAFFGSANATAAGIGGNIELLCELEGGPSRLGVGAMLDDPDGFSKLLDDYTPPSAPVIDEEEELGRRLDEYLVDVAQLKFVVTVTPDGDQWRGVIATDEAIPHPPTGASVSLSCYNRPAELVVLAGGSPVHAPLAPREAADLTPFLVLTIQARVKGRQVERSTVVTAQMVGAPADRLDEILARQIDSPEKFLRFLLLLLGLRDASMAAQGLPAGLGGKWMDGSAVGVFELLVRGLAADPSAIDRLDDLVRRLTAREDGEVVLPAGWTALWPTFVKARRLVGGSS
jgi:hypothetical protein